MHLTCENNKTIGKIPMHMWSNPDQRRAHGISPSPCIHRPYDCFATPGLAPLPSCPVCETHDYVICYDLCAAHLFACLLWVASSAAYNMSEFISSWFFLCLQGGPIVGPTCRISCLRAHRRTWAAAGCSRSTATSRCPPSLRPCSTTLRSTGECHFTHPMHILYHVSSTLSQCSHNHGWWPDASYPCTVKILNPHLARD
jgi:hypothetical protein